jgi:hypothetical protein
MTQKNLTKCIIYCNISARVVLQGGLGDGNIEDENKKGKIE